MLGDEDIEKLIQEIAIRPSIYDKRLKEYTNANTKRMNWEEICTSVVPGWNEMTSSGKTEAGQVVQKKWQNLRTCFSREMRAQKHTKSGRSAARRRKYIYFEKLLFLLPTLTPRTAEANVPQSNNNEEKVEPTKYSIQTKLNKNIETNRRRIKGEKKAILEETLLTTILQQSQNTNDEDVHFALSIVPSLKKLDDVKKIDAKIQILNVFKNLNTT